MYRKDADGDLELAGILLNAKQSASKETVSENGWLTMEQIEKQYKSDTPAQNTLFAKKHFDSKFDEKQGCEVYHYTKKMDKYGGRVEDSPRKDADGDLELAGTSKETVSENGVEEEEEWKRRRRQRRRRRRKDNNHRSGASERRRSLWAWGQNAEWMWAVLGSEGWVGVEWEMCEWEVARRREARWKQEARDRRQWLAQARWLEELWRVAMGGVSEQQ